VPRGSNPSKVQQCTDDRLERFYRSGQTVAQFRQLEGVSQPSFYQWKKKLADLAGQPSLQAKSSPPAFRAVEVIQTNPEVTPPNQAATTIRLWVMGDGVVYVVYGVIYVVYGVRPCFLYFVITAI